MSSCHVCKVVVAFSGLHVLIFLILTIYLLFFSHVIQAQHHSIRFGLQMVIIYEVVKTNAVFIRNKHATIY